MVMTKSEAWTLAPGAGKRSTRMTMSCTAPPAHRIVFAPALASVKRRLALAPGAHDMMRDGDRRWRRQPVLVPAQQHVGDLVAREPARALELGGVDLDVAALGLGEGADHQRHRERPWLRREVTHAAADDAGFLDRLAPHRVLDRLARLDEPGKARPHARHEAGRAAEQAVVAVDRQHDDDRVGAREMLRLAIRTVAPLAGVDGARQQTTIGAIAMPRMPLQNRLRIRNRRQVFGLS